jgi:hypothetical protein
MQQATQGSLDHLRRDFVANNPPVIEIKDAAVSRTPDGSVPPSLTFFLHNTGKSIATIDYCVTADRYRGGKPSIPRLHPEVSGTKLGKYEKLPVSHIFNTITTEQLDSQNPTLNPQFEVQVFYHDEERSFLDETASFRWIFEESRFVVNQKVRELGEMI